MASPIDLLNRFLDMTLKGYLISMGALTAAASLAVVTDPESNAKWLLKLPLDAFDKAVGGAELNYKPLVQHWGILLALVGLLMVGAAFREKWVFPAMVISGVEKLFIVVLGYVIYNGEFVTKLALTIDSAGMAYSLLFFVVLLIRLKVSPRTEELDHVAK